MAPKVKPIDLTAEKTTLMIQLSNGFKEAIGTYAQKHGMSSAELIRSCVATVIKYDLRHEPKPERKKRYASPEARKAAYKAKQQEERALVKKLLAEHEANERQAAIKALQASVAGK